MNIQPLKEFRLGVAARHVRCVEVDLGTDTGFVFAYSETLNVDPCGITCYTHPMKLACYGSDGQQIWKKELTMGTIPGVWTNPFIALDLDKDGVDEIFYVENQSDVILEAGKTVVKRINGATGREIGSYHFPAHNNQWERLCHAYRYQLFGGYVDGEPVFVMQQGTYRDMFFQCYNSDMSLRWERKIEYGDGPRASHCALVYDYNDDGKDEVIFGERIMSLDTGEDTVVLGKDFGGHSDVTNVFTDPKTGKRYIFCCREDGDYDGCPRALTYDMDGNVIWKDIYSDEWGHYIDDAHMHVGYVFNLENGKKAAYAWRRRIKKQLTEDCLYDALTGEKIDSPLKGLLKAASPIDINGDGVSEFLISGGGVLPPDEVTPLRIMGSNGNTAKYIGGNTVTVGKWFGFAGEQVMVNYPNEQVVRIWGDLDAVDGETIKKKYSNGYHKFMNKMKGNGYTYTHSNRCDL